MPLIAHASSRSAHAFFASTACCVRYGDEPMDCLSTDATLITQCRSFANLAAALRHVVNAARFCWRMSAAEFGSADA